MVRQDFGLHLDRVGKLLLQYLRNPPVHLLPGTAQQRGIGRILDQGVFEPVSGMWRPATLIQQFGLDQLPQAGLQRRLIVWRDGLQQVIGKFPPQHCRELRHLFGGAGRDPTWP